MDIKTLDSAELAGQVVVLRADYNVPLGPDGKIAEDTRIRASLPTVRALLEAGAARIHVLTHLGRPKGEHVADLSTEVVATRLGQLLEEEVEFRPDFSVGEGKIQLHENVRFWKGEKKKSDNFVAELKKLGGTVFVMDAFGTAHRDHASVTALAADLPSYAGKLVQKEVEAMTPYKTQEKQEGLTLMVGGAKMKTKIAVLSHFATTAENILIGGALANTFLAAQGYDVGASFYEETEAETAREVLGMADAHHCGVHLPVDVMCVDSHTESALDVPVEDVMGDMRIYDIGPHTIASFKEIIAHSRAVIWNGPVGMIEKAQFQRGTKELLEALATAEAKTVIGGGDTLAAVQQFGIDPSAFDHVSTGGGAMLEFLESKNLPGLDILKQ